MNSKYILLISNELSTFYTAYLLVKSDTPPSGIIIGNYKGLKNRIKFEKSLISKYGVFKRFSQIFASILHKLIDGRKDKNMLKELYEEFTQEDLFEIAEKLSLPIVNLKSYDYGNQKVVKFISSINPYFLVCHTPFWIPKKIRDLIYSKIIIGSHPGIIPWFRGSNSTFWARYKNKDDYNGYSIFCINSGVDSGPIIKREYIKYDVNISYRANDYLLLNMISKEIVKVVDDCIKGKLPNLKKQKPILSNQIYKNPGIIEYIIFRYKEFKKIRDKK
ncbi:formyltransferase family protein [Prochlorococcus marinus]|uniref:formyltransferase family protein n=1 Tax=Prochlorococcus marinus TaxID=1219 RepID=UPI001ADAD49B|nr:formyltransferase family protein [Prochlorococcus marinus]MBO8219578.1 hypothetical protein [Prochlorococcus marinus CUG1416]MBW3051951.1 hypothetical protein [Prochlorococcus marinus str. MU1416]